MISSTKPTLPPVIARLVADGERRRTENEARLSDIAAEAVRTKAPPIYFALLPEMKKCIDVGDCYGGAMGTITWTFSYHEVEILRVRADVRGREGQESAGLSLHFPSVDNRSMVSMPFADTWPNEPGLADRVARKIASLDSAWAEGLTKQPTDAMKAGGCPSPVDDNQ